MLQSWMTAYPFDIEDDDLSSVLDRLHGELGITGLSLWAAIPATTYPRIRVIEPRVVRTHGGLLFQPNDECYENTRCKPITSSIIKSRDPINKIVQVCRQRGMDVALIVSASLTGRLAKKHPEMVCKNIFESESEYSLCLMNPDVQSYLYSLVSDLSQQYTPNSIIVTDFLQAWIETYALETFQQTAIGPLERKLLSMCFCESCHQSASQSGMDMEMTKRSIRVMLQKSFDHGVPSDISYDRVLKDNNVLSAYDQWCKEELSSLLQRMVDSCAGECLLDRSTCHAKNLPAADMNLDIPDGVISRVDHPDKLDSMLNTPARRHELCIPHHLTLGAHSPELITLISRAVEKGCTGMHFDHYSLLPEPAMTTIKQAIRFARRSSGE